jgi:hypothetical protein
MTTMPRKYETGPNHFAWKGGRTINNGYVHIRVGISHHLANAKGYAAEHRLVGEAKIGRRLEMGEVVHHIDGNRQNNDPSNLEVLTEAEHRAEHGRLERLRHPRGENSIVSCACGCGETFSRFDSHWYERTYVAAHHKPAQAPFRTAILQALADGPRTVDELAEAISNNNQNTRAIASKLARRGLIERVSRGVYGLPGASE